MAWKLAGESFENCSCDIFRPCITYGLAFDNSGKNGHFREFAWQG